MLQEEEALPGISSIACPLEQGCDTEGSVQGTPLSSGRVLLETRVVSVTRHLQFLSVFLKQVPGTFEALQNSSLLGGPGCDAFHGTHGAGHFVPCQVCSAGLL